MRVELLFFEGCPGFEALRPRLRALVGERAVVRERAITSVEEAERERFLGSPSVRVDGVDVDPGAAERDDFGMKCRLYRSEDGQSHVPPDAWIRAALDRAAG